VDRLQYFQLSKEDGITEVLIDRSAQRNAFNEKMWMQLAEIMESCSADTGTKVVIITGAGNSFASGADITQLKDLTDTDKRHNYLCCVERAIESIVHCPQPVIAMINGWAIGAGCELAIACDIRICAEEAKFSVPAAKLGIVLHHSLIQRIVNLVGMATAKELLFVGEPVSAERAYAIGLVNKVTPASELKAVTAGMARKIADNAPLAVRGMKEALTRLSEPDQPKDLSGLDQLEKVAFESDDFLEGATAFMEKRKPVWKGK